MVRGIMSVLLSRSPFEILHLKSFKSHKCVCLRLKGNQQEYFLVLFFQPFSVAASSHHKHPLLSFTAATGAAFSLCRQ